MQQLYINGGVGYNQERGKEVQVFKKGDLVKCNPNVEHWHAATPKSDFEYLAITMDKPTKWTDTLTAETYNSIRNTELSKMDTERALIRLSKKKWQWMADKNVDKLDSIFHNKSEFVQKLEAGN